MKRENEKHKFLNRAWFTIVIVSLAMLAAGGIVTYIAEGFNILYVIGALGLVACVMTPTNYVLDNRGMCIYYLFHFKMEYLWHAIWWVSKASNHSRLGAGMFGKHIEITGTCSGPKFFDFPEVFITYNRRAQELIEKYTQTEINDYTLAGDIKRFKKKREQKKLKKQNRHHKKKK